MVDNDTIISLLVKYNLVKNKNLAEDFVKAGIVRVNGNICHKDDCFSKFPLTIEIGNLQRYIINEDGTRKRV